MRSRAKAAAVLVAEDLEVTALSALTHIAERRSKEGFVDDGFGEGLDGALLEWGSSTGSMTV